MEKPNLMISKATIAECKKYMTLEQIGLFITLLDDYDNTGIITTSNDMVIDIVLERAIPQIDYNNRAYAESKYKRIFGGLKKNHADLANVTFEEWWSSCDYYDESLFIAEPWHLEAKKAHERYQMLPSVTKTTNGTDSKEESKRSNGSNGRESLEDIKKLIEKGRSMID